VTVQRFILLLCLLPMFCCSVDVHGADEPLAGRLEQARERFSAGAYPEAAALFFQLFQQYPANSEVNFYLGRSAFESGDYETAVMAYERVLLADPGVTQAKLEMAKSFYRLGARPTAVRLFRELADSDLPAEVRAQIKAFLATTDAEPQ